MSDDTQCIEMVRDYLGKLLEDREPHHPWAGICMNLAVSLSVGVNKFNCEEFLRDLWVRWPRFSGDPYYPVPSCDVGITPEMMYRRRTSWPHYKKNYLWGDSPYGTARWELVQWLFDEITEILKERKQNAG